VKAGKLMVRIRARKTCHFFRIYFLRDSHFGNSVLKTARKICKVTGINLVDETGELMVISQFGKIIRIDTKSIRAAGRSTQGVKLLDLEPQDKLAAAVVIPSEEAKPQPEKGTLLH
jgi:DNA gyrase subunit A